LTATVIDGTLLPATASRPRRSWYLLELGVLDGRQLTIDVDEEA
jgi:hypothetical protein